MEHSSDLIEPEPSKPTESKLVPLVPEVTLPEITLSSSQEDLHINLSSLVHIRFARPWIRPTFPVPLVAYTSGAGLQTVIEHVARDFNLRCVTVSASGWLVQGSRSSMDTKTFIRSGCASMPSILLIKGLHILDGKLSQDWFTSVREEILDVLSYRSAGLENTFIVGAGHYPIRSNGEIILSENDSYSDSHNKQNTYNQSVISKFSRKKFVLTGPSEQDIPRILASHGVEYTGQTMHSFYELGDVLVDAHMDRGI